MGRYGRRLNVVLTTTMMVFEGGLECHDVGCCNRLRGAKLAREHNVVNGSYGGHRGRATAATRMTTGIAMAGLGR